MLLLLLKEGTEERDKCSAIVARSSGILPAIVVRNSAITVKWLDILSRTALHIQKTSEPKLFKLLFQTLTLLVLHLQPLAPISLLLLQKWSNRWFPQHSLPLDFRAKVRLFLLLGLLILEHPIIWLAHLICYIIYGSILVHKIFRLLMAVILGLLTLEHPIIWLQWTPKLFTVFQTFVAYIETQFFTCIKVLRSDNWGEYVTWLSSLFATERYYISMIMSLYPSTKWDGWT